MVAAVFVRRVMNFDTEDGEEYENMKTFPKVGLPHADQANTCKYDFFQ